MAKDSHRYDLYRTSQPWFQSKKILRGANIV